MNNAQFRKLLETPRPPPSADNADKPINPAQRALGSKLRSSIPMTPRSLTSSNNEFARQLAERKAQSGEQKPTRKFRSSAAPKGTKLASGYTDRAAALREHDEEEALNDEREHRLEALRQLVEDGEIEHEEYVRQTKLLGGDVSSTHLVKGLDFQLLKRVKDGEDLMAKIVHDGDKEALEEQENELEDKLEQALEQDVSAVERKKEKKVGHKAPQSRSEILAELKRQRQAAKEAAQPQLGSKFRKINQPKETKRDSDDEEEIKVKLVLGDDGKVKRKVKRKDKERERAQQQETAEMPPPQRVMGMMPPPPIPGKTAPPEDDEDEDDDIFAGVGDYDPLAGIGSDDSDSDAEAEPSKRPKTLPPPEPAAPAPTDSSSLPPPPPPATARHKTLFSDTPSDPSSAYVPPTDKASLMASSPDLAAVLHRAAQIGKKLESDDEKRKRKLVEDMERDSYDMDMGFGGSTNYDDDEDGFVEEGKKGTKRKRGGKKKGPGDKNDAEVVGRVVEERYGKDGKGK